jgi:hypothetical protein
MSEQSRTRFLRAVIFATRANLPILLTAVIVAVYKGFPDRAIDYISFLMFWCVCIFASAWGFTRMSGMQEALDRPMQFRLSTALLVTIAAALILWLNMRNRSGWPFDIRITQRHYWSGGKEIIEAVSYVDFVCLFGDVGLATMFLWLVGCASEWITHRREAILSERH